MKRWWVARLLRMLGFGRYRLVSVRYGFRILSTQVYSSEEVAWAMAARMCDRWECERFGVLDELTGEMHWSQP